MLLMPGCARVFIIANVHLQPLPEIDTVHLFQTMYDRWWVNDWFVIVLQYHTQFGFVGCYSKRAKWADSLLSHGHIYCDEHVMTRLQLMQIWHWRMMCLKLISSRCCFFFLVTRVVLYPRFLGFYLGKKKVNVAILKVEIRLGHFGKCRKVVWIHL